jgi:hypothetical protein
VAKTLDTDYLVIGAGAAGMAFVDELITQSGTARVVLVDRRKAPGGHWNNAYDFVTLHQPADFYGVNSERLEQEPRDFASKEQIVTYYQRVIEKLCATGRVQFFPECEYLGESQFRRLGGDSQRYQVTVQRRIVDATYSNVSIPAERSPEYQVDPKAHCVPINALATLTGSWTHYIVIGAGKTGIDAVLRLLGEQVSPDHIRWVMSHDPWLFNRDLMNTELFPTEFPKGLRATCRASDAADYLRIFEEHNWIMRLDPTIQTEHCRCATVTLDELAQLRRISNIVRLGRVTRIEVEAVMLERGQIPTGPHVLHIDCTANGLERRPARPVFEGNRITLQPLVLCMPAFSAAMTASIEVREKTDEKRNRSSQPVPYPDTISNYFEALLIWQRNSLRWIPRHSAMMFSRRLSLLTHLSLWGKLRLLVGVILWGYRAFAAVERIVRRTQKQRTSP